MARPRQSATTGRNACCSLVLRVLYCCDLMTTPSEALAERSGSSSRRGRWQRWRAHARSVSVLRRWSARALIALLVVGSMVAGSLSFYAWKVNNDLQRIAVDNLAGSSPGGTDNILIAGSTNRCGLKINSPVFGSCAAGVTGVNSDVVMIVHLDAKHHSASLLSIPRDLFVPNARSTGVGKIDAALAEGPSQLVNVIEQDLGIPINHYVELNFDGFQGVVNALGGVKMYFPEPVYDANSGLDIRQAGCRSLDGFQALAVVRARHLQYRTPSTKSSNPHYWPFDPESDLSRIRRDHEFLRVLADSVAAQGLANPVTDQALISTLVPQMQVDSGMSLSHIVELVKSFHDVHSADVPQNTLPVTVVNGLSFMYQGSDYGSVELPDQAMDHQIIDQFLGADPGTDTMTGAALPDPTSITVAIRNGNTKTGTAKTTAASLQRLGYHTNVLPDSKPTGPLSETLVAYNSTADRAAAEQVAHSMVGAVVLAQDATLDQGTITLTVGTNSAVNNPADTVTTAPGRTTTTASKLSDPTPATSDLSEFDPRSCTPNGDQGP